MSLVYKIFDSSEGDWFVAAKMEEKEPIVVYRGHNRGEAYRNILEDMGFDIPIEERDMEDAGDYFPTPEDFE